MIGGSQMSCDEQCITEIPASDSRPSGHRVTKSVTDLRGERRTLTRTVRGHDSLERAIKIRDEIDRKKDSVEWLRRQFSEPKGERRQKNLLGHLGVEDEDVIYEPKTDQPKDPAERLKSMTLRAWVEAGVYEDSGHPDAISGFVPTEEPDFRGWIREAMDRQSLSTTRVKISTWNHLRRWGVLTERSPAEATLEHVRSFRDFLEADPALSSKESIATYLKKARQVINGWSIRAGVQKPLRQSLDYGRIRGNDPKSKVVDLETLRRLGNAFRERAESEAAKRWPRRRMVWSIFRVHRLTGMRSGELLGLKRTDLDRTSQTLHIQRSVDPSGELVPIKEVQISGDTTRTKRVPLLDPALEAIDQWLDSRSDWGWPADADLIFCREDGTPWLGRSLWRAYQRASETADLSDPVSPHQVRHSVNDALREAGVSVDVRRAILGHSSDDTNRGYTDPKATEALDGLQQVAEQLS